MGWGGGGEREREYGRRSNSVSKHSSALFCNWIAESILKMRFAPTAYAGPCSVRQDGALSSRAL